MPQTGPIPTYETKCHQLTLNFFSFILSCLFSPSRSMNYPCDAVWGDFHTIWDLDAHDIPSESYASLLRNKTGEQ